MGIYSNYNASSIDDGSFTPRDLFAECGETATYEELSLAMVAESEQNYISIMKAIGLNEVNYFAQNGEEIVYEAGGVSGILNKIKEFFKKLIEKIRQILHTFLTKLSSFASSDSSFVQKYQQEFSTKWGKLKSDYEFNGYEFTVKLDNTKDVRTSYASFAAPIVASTSGASEKAVEAAMGATADISSLLGISEDLKKAVDDIRDNKSDIQDKLRGYVAKEFSSFLGKSGIAGTPSFDASEFSKELFADFRNGEETKQGIELKNKMNPRMIVEGIKDTEKYKKAAQKLTDNIVKGLNDEVKKLDTLEKNLAKLQTSDEMDKQKDKQTASNRVSDVLSLVTESNALVKDLSSYYVQANGIYLQAITDRNRQYKAIMVKVIGSSKKVTESYNDDGDYEGIAETANYFDKIVLK